VLGPLHHHVEVVVVVLVAWGKCAGLTQPHEGLPHGVLGHSNKGLCWGCVLQQLVPCVEPPNETDGTYASALSTTLTRKNLTTRFLGHFLCGSLKKFLGAHVMLRVVWLIGCHQLWKGSHRLLGGKHLRSFLCWHAFYMLEVRKLFLQIAGHSLK